MFLDWVSNRDVVLLFIFLLIFINIFHSFWNFYSYTIKEGYCVKKTPKAFSILFHCLLHIFPPHFTLLCFVFLTLSLKEHSVWRFYTETSPYYYFMFKKYVDS